jgi:hypothetical protein
MPFCPNCGAEVEAGEKFCYNCGASLLRGQGKTPQPSVQSPTPQQLSTPQVGAKRPKGIVLLIVLDVLVGAAWILAGLLSSFVPSLASGGAMLIALGVLSVVSGYGVFAATSWGWVLGLVTGVGYLVVGFLMASLVGVINIAFGAWVVVYIITPSAREYLRKHGRGSGQNSEDG